MSFYVRILFLIFSIHLCWGQVYNNLDNVPDVKNKVLKWCTVGLPEYKKCQAFSDAVKHDASQFQSWFLDVKCVNGSSKEDCMFTIEEERADVTVLDPGEVFSAGRYFSLLPISQEVYAGNRNDYLAVAVVKKDSLKDVTSLKHLRGKKACFAGVGTLAGWIIPIGQLMKHGGLEVVDCNNHVKNAVTYFGPSCAVNSLIDKYNPIGDNSDKLCKLCIGKVPGGKCTNADPYAGFTGAFKCLLEAGEIAFLKHTSVLELTADSINFPTVNKNDFELLCLDGKRKPIEEYNYCNWGSVPSHAVVTSSAKNIETRRIYQKFLETAFEIFGLSANKSRQVSTQHSDQDQYNRYDNENQRDQFGREINFNRNGFNQFDGYSTVSPIHNQTENKHFFLFESVPQYGNEHDLLFSDVAEQLSSIGEGVQTFKEYLGRSLESILEIRRCPIKAVTLCVTSDQEMEKCHKMRTALKAQLLQPDLVCYKAHNHIHCMQAIRNGDADISVFDAGDIYTSGLQYSLVPIMAEVYNLGVPEYYAVAVSKEEDPSTEITYLKGKNTCHGGVNTGAGWIIPMAFLLANGWIRSYGCDSMKAASEYFSKMCLPGSQSPEYNIGLPYDNMCQLCHGTSYRYCHRDASEDYYGHTGAFRCLVEGGGDVAFVKHTTISENTDGKRKEWWARNTLKEDFQLLCPDGTRSTMDNYEQCNLGRVKANAIVARGGYAYNRTEINAYLNLFVYAQQFYGRKDQDDFNFAMFSSSPPYADLIFQDATTQLQVIPEEKRWFSDYLGKDFMRAKRLVDCYAGSSQIIASMSLIISMILLTLFYTES